MMTINSYNSEDTFKCPKCKTLWRVPRDQDDEKFAFIMGTTVESDEQYCPSGCINFFGFKIKGKLLDTT